MIESILRIGLFAVAAGTAGSAVWLASDEKPEGAAIIATLCVLLCVFVFLSRFKRFEGLGFKGELWEQEMEKANEIRRALGDLSEQQAENIFWQMGPGSRWKGIDNATRFKIVGGAERNLKTAGFNDQKIEELKRPWHTCVMRDLADPIAVRVCDLIRQGTGTIEGDEGPISRPDAGNKAAHKLNDLIWRDDYKNVPSLLRH